MSRQTHAVFPAGQGPTNPYRAFRLEEIEQSIPERFGQQVLGDPAKLAVETATQSLTYEALNQAANRLAWAILEQRGGAAEPVAFLLDHGAAAVVAILGILKAGKIYVPFEVASPPARNRSVLEDARPGLLVTDNANRLLAEQTYRDCPILNLDDLAAFNQIKDPNLAIAPDRPAVLLYTSGSTGKPKGLVHSHRNLLHVALKFTNNLHVSREDRLVLLYSFVLAGSVADIFAGLLNGASLFPFSVKVQGIANLAHWLADKEITLYQSVPTVFRQLVTTLNGSERFPCLRLIRLGGESVTPRDAQLHRKHFASGCQFAVSFGSSEILGVRLYFVDHAMPPSGPRIPVGYELQDTEVLILNEHGAPVEAGCIGEMAIRSPYLALGYWRDPQRTQAVFRPDPDRPGVRVYRSGDLGVLRQDGCLEYLGRADFQVKVRGNRVELAEIEAALLELDLKDAVVVGQETSTGGQRLVAYVVPANRSTATVSALRSGLHEKLPDYMIPSVFVMLDALPLTPTGKVERRSLPVPAAVRPALLNPYVPPRDALQILLTEVWQDCLNVQPVGLQDDFFELGGDSLLAVEMVQRTEEMCGRAVALETLLSTRTVEQFAHLLVQQGTNPMSPALMEVHRGDSGRRFFYVHGDFNGGGIYCVPLARHLGTDKSFYAVHPHGLSTPLVPASIEEMAADRLRVLREIQPEGPYLLGGHCNGSLVAFEMAQQLARQDQPVDLLVVIAPPLNVQWGSQARSAAAAPADLTGLLYRERRTRLLQAYDAVCARYVMQHFAGDLAVVLPRDDLAYYGPLERWRAAATHVELHVIPGGHVSILTSRHVRELARLMQNYLSRW